jgi:hypothetical protein
MLCRRNTTHAATSVSKVPTLTRQNKPKTRNSTTTSAGIHQPSPWPIRHPCGTIKFTVH